MICYCWYGLLMLLEVFKPKKDYIGNVKEWYLLSSQALKDTQIVLKSRLSHQLLSQYLSMSVIPSYGRHHTMCSNGHQPPTAVPFLAPSVCIVFTISQNHRIF